MSTHNICLYGEIRKIIIPELSWTTPVSSFLYQKVHFLLLLLFLLLLYRVYSFSYFKYGIYKPREVKKKSNKEMSAKHEFLYRIFFTSRGL